MTEVDEELASDAMLEQLRTSRSLADGFIPIQPEPLVDRTRFALASCQYPASFIDEGVAYAAYRDLALRLGGSDAPRFIVMTGDQVYTDATAGLLDPSIADGRYRLPYNRWLGARAARTALRQVHSYMLLDDHEIENDWEATAAGESYTAGVRSYRKYQRGIDEAGNTPLYFDFEFDGFAFFMLDTRTRRQLRDLANIESANMLDGQGGGSQLSTLRNWINVGSPDHPKFIVSPSMLLPRHRSAARRDAPASALHSDSWDGYLASLHSILALAYDSSSENIVFLSGDEHIGCLATITVTKNGEAAEKILHSIHTPGLYTPFAFINSNMNDWLPETNREFTVGADTYEYTVSYTPFPGEGFVYIDTAKQGSTWHLSCQFADGPINTLF